MPWPAPAVLFDPVEAVIAGFQHGVAEFLQRIGAQCGVIGVAAVLIGVHDLQPFLEIAGLAKAL